MTTTARPRSAVLADANATLARIRRRARRADELAPDLGHFHELAEVLEAAEEIAEEARELRSKLGEAVALARSEGRPCPSLEAMGAAFGVSKAAAGRWRTR